MLDTRLDYFILRSIAHRRNLASEQQLDDAFMRSVQATGWEFDFLAVNTFLKRWPALRAISDWLTRIPGLQDYFIHNVYAVLRLLPSPSPVYAMNEGARS